MVPDTTKGDHNMPKTNDAALAAFMARKTEIDTMLWSCPRLTGHSGGCGLSCDELAW